MLGTGVRIELDFCLFWGQSYLRPTSKKLDRRGCYGYHKACADPRKKDLKEENFAGGGGKCRHLKRNRNWKSGRRKMYPYSLSSCNYSLCQHTRYGIEDSQTPEMNRTANIFWKDVGGRTMITIA